MYVPADGSSEVSRLRWRCRRGMRELDVLLVRWLENQWADASPEQRQAFRTVLDQEDDLLWNWVTGRQQPDDPVVGELLAGLADGRR